MTPRHDNRNGTAQAIAPNAPGPLTSPCPECRTPMMISGLPPAGNVGLCPVCAAVYLVDVRTGPRLLRTQEWVDVSFKAGYDDLWAHRKRLLERLTAPPRGVLKTRVEAQP